MSSIVSEKDVHWFAATTKPKQEKAIRDRLNSLEIENFIPTEIVVRQWKYRKSKVEIPLIPCLVFVRTTLQQSFRVANDYCLPMRYIKDADTRTSLIIPDKQMNDFMRVVNSRESSICFEQSQLAKGDKVQVVSGVFAGLEGTLIKFSGKHKVLVDLQGIIAVSFTVEEGELKKI